MSKTIPTAIVLPDPSAFQPGRPVKASDWTTMVEALHYIYGRQGAVLQGPVWQDPWESLDYSASGDVYHTSNQASPADYDLDDWQGLFAFRRQRYDTSAGANGYNIQLDVYARNLDVRATLTRLDTEDGTTASATSFTSLVTSHASADSEWQTDYLDFTPDQASRGGSTANGLAYFLVHIEAKVPAAGAGYLWTWALRETPIITGTVLPRPE